VKTPVIAATYLTASHSFPGKDSFPKEGLGKYLLEYIEKSEYILPVGISPEWLPGWQGLLLRSVPWK
jgi:hypothetical protein